jgi:polygalacturonase
MKLSGHRKFVALFTMMLAGCCVPANLALAVPPLPVIPANVFYATNYGAMGDGLTNNAGAIQAAINAASTAGGGTVEITAAGSNYMCGPLTLKSSINFQVDAGATLQMLPIASWPGSTTFINGSGLHDVEISGSGTIDGNAHFGTGEWWAPASSRPNFINFDSKTTRILIQNVTLQNPPTFHLMLKGNNANITIQGITINTPGTSPNTDGMDLGSTNMLIQNCYISDGDDNIEIGGSSALAAYIMVTNCTFGTGHGVSIGSLVQAGVSNLTVINCSFTGTKNGIRLKSDNDRGGIVQDCSYYNIAMTNVNLPIQIYSYYDTVGTPDNISPQTAAGETVAAPTATMPTFRNITISNVSLTAGGDIGGIIWGRTEWPVTNVTFSNIRLTAPKTFDIYNARGITIADSQFNFTSGHSLTFYNAQVTVTNSSPAGVQPITLDGLATNSTSILLSLYNTLASLSNTNLLDVVPALTTGGTTLTVSNSLALVGSSVLNLVLGTNVDTVVVKTNLTFSGTVNITAGDGFGGGTYTLATYGGSLTWNSPALGTLPAGYNFAFNTNTAGQVKLVVTQPAPPAPTNLVAAATNLLINLKWNAVNGATNYNVKRGAVNNGPYPTVFSVTATNYADAAVSNAVSYFYVVTAAGAGGESTNSAQVSAVPLPSSQPTNLVMQVVGNQLQLSWPQDHLGWRLQIQTNDLSGGLGTNWATVPNSTNVMATNIIVSPTNGSVFLRLVYP